MTDPDLTPDDELVSAVLDGEATPDERARVEADPAARARLAELAAARDLVAAPVVVPADARERAVEAALAAFDAESGGPGSDGETGGSTSGAPPADELGARRARRGRSLPYLAAAAAVVLVLVGVVGVLRALNPSANVTVASQSASAPTTPALDEARGAEEDQSVQPGGAVTTSTVPTAPTTTAAGAPSTTTPAASTPPAAPPTTDLGRLGTATELRDAALRLVDEDLTSGRVADGAFQTANGTCATRVMATDPEVVSLLATATATYQGAPVDVLALAIDRTRTPAANGTVRIYAVDTATCAPVAVLTVR